jgi:hypothetical protein
MERTQDRPNANQTMADATQTRRQTLGNVENVPENPNRREVKDVAQKPRGVDTTTIDGDLGDIHKQQDNPPLHTQRRGMANPQSKPTPTTYGNCDEDREREDQQEVQHMDPRNSQPNVIKFSLPTATQANTAKQNDTINQGWKEYVETLPEWEQSLLRENEATDPMYESQITGILTSGSAKEEIVRSCGRTVVRQSYACFPWLLLCRMS